MLFYLRFFFYSGPFEAWISLIRNERVLLVRYCCLNVAMDDSCKLLWPSWLCLFEMMLFKHITTNDLLVILCYLQHFHLFNFFSLSSEMSEYQYRRDSFEWQSWDTWKLNDLSSLIEWEQFVWLILFSWRKLIITKGKNLFKIPWILFNAKSSNFTALPLLSKP